MTIFRLLGNMDGHVDMHFLVHLFELFLFVSMLIILFGLLVLVLLSFFVLRLFIFFRVLLPFFCFVFLFAGIFFSFPCLKISFIIPAFGKTPNA